MRRPAKTRFAFAPPGLYNRAINRLGENMRSFDAARAVADGRELSFPRLVGTPDEVRARELIKNKLLDIDLAVEERPFSFYPALAFGILKNMIGVGVALLIVQALVLAAWPRLGALAGLALPLIARRLWATYRRAAAHMLEDRSDEYRRHTALIRHARASLHSANLVADLPHAGEIKHRVVLSAHTDTKSQNMSIVVRIVCSLLFALGVFVLPIALLPAAVWPVWLAAGGWLWKIVWLAALVGGIVLLTLTVENRSPGATDDAGSCAVMLETARALAADPPRGVAVRLVFTGAEELGLAGGLALAREMAADPEWKNATFLNLEGVGGASKLWLATGAGPTGNQTATAARAVELAKAAAADAGVTAKTLSRIVGGEADHIPLLEAGLSAVTLMFHGDYSRKVHTAGDAPDLLREQHMATAGRILLAAIARLEG